MTTTISSQRYLDDEIVASKRDAKDYVVTVFGLEYDGESYDVVVDGHHSLAAAKADGVAPEYVQASGELARQYAAEIELRGTEAWLESHYHDSAYYDVETGIEVW